MKLGRKRWRLIPTVKSIEIYRKLHFFAKFHEATNRLYCKSRASKYY